LTIHDVDDVVGEADDAPTTNRTGRPWKQALAADLRGMIPDLSIALLVTASVWLLFWWRIENQRSQTIQLMPHLADFKFWSYWLCQAFGWSALLWAWGTTLLGLLVAGGRPRWLPGTTKSIEKLHRTTSLTVIVLSFAHIMALFFRWVAVSEGSEPVLDALKYCFVPWTYYTGTGRLAFTLGSVAFYLAMVLGLTYYFRSSIGMRVWRFAHRFTIVVYILAVWHTFLYGTNVWFIGWQRTLLWAMQLPIAVMFVARLLAPLRRSERLPLQPGELAPRLSPMVAMRLGVRVVGAVAVVVLVGVLALDRTGGYQRPAEYPSEAEQRGSGDH
jgi:sulfoxide reductase heme-binding subunit YedZ